MNKSNSRMFSGDEFMFHKASIKIIFDSTKAKK